MVFGQKKVYRWRLVPFYGTVEFFTVYRRWWESLGLEEDDLLRRYSMSIYRGVYDHDHLWVSEDPWECIRKVRLCHFSVGV